MRAIRHASALALFVMCLARPAAAADVVFPLGSKVGLAPPGGLVASQVFRGFEDRQTGAAILTLEMPAPAYAEVAKAMTADALKKQGVTVEKRETLTLKTGKAILILGRQETDGIKVRKWILLASAPELTALITMLVPDAAANAYPAPAVRDAFTTFAVRASVPIDEQLGLLPFKFDELAGLRAFRVVEPNTVFLTDGAKDTLNINEQAMMVISAARGGPENTPEREIFARNLFASVGGFKDVRVVGTDVIRLAGQQTYQLMAEAREAETGADVKLVQWLRFGNGAFMRMLGVARADIWSDAFPRFRAVRDGVIPR